MASENVTKIVEELKTLTVLELSELVSAVEEEFGVSVAAAVAVAAPAEGGAAAAEEKTEFDVVLTDAYRTRFRSLRLLRKQPALDLKRLRRSLTPLPRPSKRLFPPQMQRLLRLRSRKQAQLLNSNNCTLLNNETACKSTPFYFCFIITNERSFTDAASRRHNFDQRIQIFGGNACVYKAVVCFLAQCVALRLHDRGVIV